MERYKTTIERAFELAESGFCADFREVRAKLRGEGYDLDQLEGTSLRKQLNQICQKARADADRK